MAFLSLLAALAGSALADRPAQPRGRPARRMLGETGWRLALPVLLWLSVSAITGRTILAAGVCVATIAVLVAISNLKQRHLREPLVFSDFAFLAQIARHPHLFYLGRRDIAALFVAAGVATAAIAGWLAFEPPSLDAAGRIAAAILALCIAAAFALMPDGLVRAARRAVPRPDLDADVARLGLLATLPIYWLLWRAEPPMPAIGAPRANDVRSETARYARVIVVQAESFVDVRRFGRTDVAFPALDRMKARALSHGLLEVPCQGAYTLRPESALIGGVGFRDQGFDGFHPYLRPERVAHGALPRMLSARGWRTVFLHPHDIRFFRRDRAIPQFGFATTIDETRFAPSDRHGPYVSDAAVARAIVEEARAAQQAAQPIFLFAVTMEAHDPYGPGRLAGEDDPVRQYLEHLRNADRMLATLADAFDHDEGRTLLAFYGDHVPFLPDLADPFPDSRTDHVIVELGRTAAKSGPRASIASCEEMHGFLRLLLNESASFSTEPRSVA